MAQTFYQPNYATDRRFAPSGFTIPSGPSIEEQNRMANAPAQVAQPGQQGQAAPAKAPARSTEKLEKLLGIPIGDPRMRAATAEATSMLPAPVQLANGVREQGNDAFVAQWSQIMESTGGLPDPSRYDFAERQKAGIALMDRMKQQQQGAPTNSFIPPANNAYMGGGPAVTGAQALAANGQELSGYGGTLVSGQTVQGDRQTYTSGRPNETGQHNRFLLRQNPNTIPAEGSFTPPSSPVAQVSSAPAGAQTVPSQAAMRFLADGVDRGVAAPAPVQRPAQAASPAQSNGGSFYEQANQQYDAAVAASRAPRQSPLPYDYEVDPSNPNAVRPKAGSKDYVEQTKAAEKYAKRHANAAFAAKGIIGEINDADKLISKETTGLSSYSRAVRGSKAFDLNEKLETIMSDSAFSRLQQMREESPTGGALGNVANYELEALKRARGSLSQGQSEAQLRASLKKVKGHYERFYMANAGFDPDNKESVKEFYSQMGSDVFDAKPEAGATQQPGGSPIRITSIKLVP